MTAALIIETLERTETRRPVAVKSEPKLITMARRGDEAAIATLLDLTSDSVYAFAFGATNKSRSAERITDTVIQRMPRLLRRQRWDSVEALTSALMGIARSEVATYNRRAARSNESRDVRAWTRHAILAATSISTIIYAGVLAF